MTPEQPPPALWSVREVRELLTVLHGGRRRADGTWYPNTAAVAAAHKVSRRSVERWIAGSATHRAPMPHHRLEALLSEHRPTEKTLRREAYERSEVAEKRLRRQLGRGRGNVEELQRLGWLDRHLVAIVQEDAGPLRRILTTRLGSKSQRTQQRGVTVLSELEVHDRINAESIRYEVLRLITPWRIQVSSERIARGGTQTWLESAPLIPLHAVANALLLDQD